jgi:hypothetical protein
MGLLVGVELWSGRADDAAGAPPCTPLPGSFTVKWPSKTPGRVSTVMFQVSRTSTFTVFPAVTVHAGEARARPLRHGPSADPPAVRTTRPWRSAGATSWRGAPRGRLERGLHLSVSLPVGQEGLAPLRCPADPGHRVKAALTQSLRTVQRLLLPIPRHQRGHGGGGGAVRRPGARLGRLDPTDKLTRRSWRRRTGIDCPGSSPSR